LAFPAEQKRDHHWIPSARYRVALGALVAADVLLRLWIAMAIPSRPISDFAEYFATARSLLESGRYEISPGNPNANHPPAYPLLLAGAMRVAPAGNELFAAKRLNAALSGLAVILGAALARRLGGPAAGLWTAGWIAFFPRSLLSADLVASENLFAPLLLLFLLLCALSWTSERRRALAASIGFVVGALALTRSVAYFLPAVWLLGALAARRRPRAWAVELLLILATQHALMLPWALRNARTFGRFTFLNNVGGMGLFIGNNPHATGHWYPWAGDLERLRPGVHARGIAAVDAAAREEAWRWIRENPGRAAALYAHKLRLILTDDADAANFAIFAEAPSVLPGPHPLKARAALLSTILRVSGLLLAAAGLGGWMLLARRAVAGSERARVLAVGFAAAALYVPVLSAAVAVSGRYRWPAEDVLMPLAGLFCAWIASGRRSGR
jgi:4-amino-4-deoxy-L-arabinose transferase-like glycosyltransferase